MNYSEATNPITHWDILIIGGGPSGAAAAMQLHGKGFSVAVIDKAIFPRDKICGDALSPDVIQQLAWISPSLANRFEHLEKRKAIIGLKVFAPNNSIINLEFKVKKLEKGYVVARLDLDALFMEELESLQDISVFQGTETLSIDRTENGFQVQTDKGVFNGKLIIGADGNHSLVAKQLAGRAAIDRKHHCAALRQYYSGVAWPEGEEHIELHFIDEVLPGYLWVFPMSGGRANVGIGMLSEHVAQKKVNLKKVLEKQLKENPAFLSRFANAEALETVKGYGIPIGSKRYRLSGDGYMLVGDAACLVDPLTGEGIANAIRSGRYAAKFAAEAMHAARSDAKFLSAYDKKIYALVGDELRLSRFIQRCFRSRRILNATVWLASRSKAYRRLIHLLFEETHFYTEWARPSFYWKLLTKRR